MEQLCKATVLTKLDLRSAYNLVYIQGRDKWKTAFIFKMGHYQLKVMPYGLALAPSVFQWLINGVLREYLRTYVIAYIDGILIYYAKKAAQITHVR